MSAKANKVSVRPDWLAKWKEAPIDPEQPVIDAHHHLYQRSGITYLLPDYLADISGGHDVRASVFVQARAMLRSEGPEADAAIGETEFVNGIAAMSASGLYGGSRVCAGIVGFADLTQGDGIKPLLERHLQAAGQYRGKGGRFRGIRQTLCWDEDASLLNPLYPTAPEMMSSDAFRAGFAHLKPLGLSFDAWVFFPQAKHLVDLARAFPDTRITVDHCGGAVGIKRYADDPENFRKWQESVTLLSKCPNVSMKLSGLGMRLSGFGFDEAPFPPKSTLLAEAWEPWVDHCLKSFGPSRCMWGSNFPVDKGTTSYDVGLNAMKRLLTAYSASERHSVFYDTANQFYNLVDIESTI